MVLQYYGITVLGYYSITVLQYYSTAQYDSSTNSAVGQKLWFKLQCKICYCINTNMKV